MQSFINFDAINKNSMKELKNTSDKIREAQEIEVLSLHQKLHRAKLAIGKVS
jgi:hypothetical protein